MNHHMYVVESDAFVFLLSSSANPIQNTNILLLDRYGPPKTNQVKPSDNEPTELDNSAYNPHIDSYGSPTADPANIVTAESSHFSSTEKTVNNNINQLIMTLDLIPKRINILCRILIKWQSDILNQR